MTYKVTLLVSLLATRRWEWGLAIEMGRCDRKLRLGASDKEDGILAWLEIRKYYSVMKVGRSDPRSWTGRDCLLFLGEDHSHSRDDMQVLDLMQRTFHTVVRKLATLQLTEKKWKREADTQTSFTISHLSISHYPSEHPHHFALQLLDWGTSSA